MRHFVEAMKHVWHVPAGILAAIAGVAFAVSYALANPHPTPSKSPTSVVIKRPAVTLPQGVMAIDPDGHGPSPAIDWNAPSESPKAIEAPKPKDLAAIVDDYLCEVYQRTPVKRDGAGDFTWKDPAAAKRLKMDVCQYVIGGMNPDFREQLYHAGQKMDAAGLKWSMLSAFRDDYRQKIATGYKAHGGNSKHGGSRATRGYGDGQAVDVTAASGPLDPILHWIDNFGRKLGLYRPMPGADPAHVQPTGGWHTLASLLRLERTGTKDSGIQLASASSYPVKLATVRHKAKRTHVAKHHRAHRHRIVRRHVKHRRHVAQLQPRQTQYWEGWN
jgi:hypothetical protein